MVGVHHQQDDLNTILSVAFSQLFTNSACSDRTERNEEDKYLLVRESGVPMEQNRLRKLALPFPLPVLPSPRTQLYYSKHVRLQRQADRVTVRPSSSVF